ncbi:MAG TPA: glycoside hydrolase family 3 N-terminal domain-containing protein [Vicinamibacteria bacterium]|nr:glycoside hydrolase family 3 N-terminal domain-containing protein [Vicinamibacteria bacterium]
MNRAGVWASALLTLASTCGHPKAVVPPPLAPTPPARLSWARETLGRLSLPEKVAQMIGVRAYGLYRNPETAEAQELKRRVAVLGVGSICVFESEVESLPRLLNELQGVAKLPLLVSADMERGMSFRIRRGVVALPYAMAFGATGSIEDARFMGEVAAREGRALGVHWALAPVADVNNNPANPVINIRSFGEDAERAAGLVAAFVRGAREGGLLTTVKHFPGHGDTAVDSHLALASLGADRARLDAVELLPFRRAIGAGVDSVMLGHIAVPALDATGAPATLSPVLTTLLRKELGFGGLVVTDALDMAGAKAAWTGDAAKRAVLAGADMILLPPDPEVAIGALVRAVKEGEIDESRIDQSVLRILEVKERLGLHRERRVEVGALTSSVGRPADVQRAVGIARRAVTVVKNERGLLPLKAEAPLAILHLVLSSDARNDAIQGIPEAELAARKIVTETLNLGPEVSEATTGRILAQAQDFTHVLASCFVRVGAYRGNADMAESHAKLIEALVAAGRPVIVVSYGSPYLLKQVPDVAAYLATYGWADPSQRSAVSALFGEHPVTGTLPVTLPGLFPLGHGLKIPRREMTLRMARPEEAGFRSDGMAEVDQVVEKAVAGKAFPGAVLAVGKDSALVHLKAFGRESYQSAAPLVTTDTLYDLASLTKVVVTTTLAMVLVDEGKLDLDQPVAAFLPGFRGGAKDRVTVTQLLTHSGGLKWWAPLHEELKGKDAYLERIAAMDLDYEPGTKSVYSDLGVILLGEVLERVAGESLEAFAKRRLFAPLGMKDTGYRPPAALLPRIAPTEQDDKWRKRLLRGEVHDENAFALGGVAPHAGLFGSAPDLARFAQMLLNGGVYDHQRLVSRATVERFTRRAGVPGSSRALGWDTPSEGSSAGSLLSARSFGHTGFTGTSMWMDPERRLFVILLSNRVHPTRENNAIRDARRAVADAVVRGLAVP